jgi:hypothetical protein
VKEIGREEANNVELKVLLQLGSEQEEQSETAQRHGHQGAPCTLCRTSLPPPGVVFQGGFKQVPCHNICVKLPFMTF